VLLGTDYPYDMAEPDPLGFIARAKLTAKDRARIHGLNAAELLGIDVKARRRKK
jgi:aminocarboxymuconate-semialdehyde decarboxylase